MEQYLLSTYAVAGAVPGAPTTPEEMQSFMERVSAVETEMDASGAFVFGDALQNAKDAKVIQEVDRQVLQSEGPFAETDSQLAGFYIINAEDLDSALNWASRIAEATQHPIEVRPFRATGRVQA